MAVHVYTTVAVVTSYEFMFPSQQKSLHKSTSLFANETSWGPPQCISAFLISCQTNLKLQATEVDPQRLAEVLMAAAVQELRQQCLKRGAAGIKGLGRQEKYPSLLKNNLQVFVCEYMSLWFRRKTEVMRCSISKSVVLIPVWCWWWIIPTVPLSKIINLRLLQRDWTSDGMNLRKNKAYFTPKSRHISTPNQKKKLRNYIVHKQNFHENEAHYS